MSADHSVDSVLIIAPVRNGSEQALRARLADLPLDAESPFSKIAGTHMARLVFLPHLRKSSGKPLDGTAYLLFGGEFDGTAASYLDALVRLPELRDIFQHCAGYREDGESQDLRRLLDDYQVRPGHSIVAFPDADLEQVLTSLELRQRIIDFVLRTRDHTPDERKAEWLASFGNGP